MTRTKAEVASADQPELLPSPQIRLSGWIDQRQRIQSLATFAQPNQPQVAGLLRFPARRIPLNRPPASSRMARTPSSQRELHGTQQRRTRHDLASLRGFRSPAQASAIRGQHAGAARHGRAGLLAADKRTGFSQATVGRSARACRNGIEFQFVTLASGCLQERAVSDE